LLQKDQHPHKESQFSVSSKVLGSINQCH